MRLAFALLSVGLVAACAREEPAGPALPAWTFAQAEIFPADRSLMRPEDGVVLADGRVIVADQAYGLRAISADGSSAPFGAFAAAGYRHAPPATLAGPNGVSFEPGGRHVLVADIYSGVIWRVAVADETTTVVYAHPYGVNSAERDSTGALWFTQSTENAPGASAEAQMFAAIDRPVANGALYRIAPSADGQASAPALVIDGLRFANGLAIDEKRGALYVAETQSDRVIGFKVDLSTGALSDRRTIAEVQTPDNLKLDGAGRLWVASPIRNEILIVDPENGKAHSAFRAASPENDAASAEWRRRLAAGEPLLDLMTPQSWAPMPGLLTSVILSPSDGPVYIAGLGDALVKLDR